MRISMRNLTARELASVAKKLHNEENSMKIVATLLTVSEFVDRKEKIVNQAIIPHEQLTKDGTLVGEYKSATEAQYKCGLGSGTVGKACNGGLKTLGGYIWKWREEYGTH